MAACLSSVVGVNNFWCRTTEQTPQYFWSISFEFITWVTLNNTIDLVKYMFVYFLGKKLSKYFNVGLKKFFFWFLLWEPLVNLFFMCKFITCKREHRWTVDVHIIGRTLHILVQVTKIFAYIVLK